MGAASERLPQRPAGTTTIHAAAAPAGGAVNGVGTGGSSSPRRGGNGDAAALRSAPPSPLRQDSLGERLARIGVMMHGSALCGSVLLSWRAWAAAEQCQAVLLL